MDLVWHYLVAGGLFLAFDSVWIGLVANKFYKRQLGDLMAAKPKLVPAAIFYIINIVAILVFVVEPALDRGSLGFAAGRGALLGLALYATYNLTNHSTLKGWPAKMTYVDLLWGTFITATVCTLTFAIFN